MTAFKIGDRVTTVNRNIDIKWDRYLQHVLETFDHQVPVGTVTDIIPSDDGIYPTEIGIQWDVKGPLFHTCGGTCKLEHGYYLAEGHVCHFIDSKPYNPNQEPEDDCL